MPVAAIAEPPTGTRTDPRPDAARLRAPGDSFGAALTSIISPQAPEPAPTRPGMDTRPSSDATPADAASPTTASLTAASLTAASLTAASPAAASLMAASPTMVSSTPASPAGSPTTVSNDTAVIPAAGPAFGARPAVALTCAPASKAVASGTTTSGSAVPSNVAPANAAPAGAAIDATKPHQTPANTATSGPSDIAGAVRPVADGAQTVVVATAPPMNHGAAGPPGATRHATARDPTTRDTGVQEPDVAVAGDTVAALAATAATQTVPPPSGLPPLPGLSPAASFAGVPASAGSAGPPARTIARDMAVSGRAQADIAEPAAAQSDADAALAGPGTRPVSGPASPATAASAAATPDGLPARPDLAADPRAVPGGSQSRPRHAQGDSPLSEPRPAVPPDSAAQASPARASSGPAGSDQTTSAQPPTQTTFAQDPVQAATPPTAQLALPATPATPPEAGAVTSGEPAPSPAAQVVPAMLAMHSANGAQNMMLRLTPSELGTVQIQISRDHDGAASVSVLVERPETLRLLLHDQAQLQHALTQAGLPQDRIVAFQQAPAGSFAAQDHRASTQDPGQNPGTGGQGQAGRDGATRQDQTGQGREAQSGAARFGPPAQPYASAWQPAGIDITA